MKWNGKTKGVGFYFLILAAVLALVSFARYMQWAPLHYAMSPVILIGLIAGFAVNILLLFWDNEYVVIITTVLYAVGLFQLLVNSVGSFVDAYQGIVMFGDPTQVGTIVSISVGIAGSCIAMIIAGFLTRVKQAEPNESL